MSLTEDSNYKKKLIFGIIILIIGILFIYFTSGLLNSSLMQKTEATYAFYMSIALLIPSIVLLIPKRNEKSAETIKYMLYLGLGMYLIHTLRLLPFSQGPLFGYYIIAILFTILNFISTYIR